MRVGLVCVMHIAHRFFNANTYIMRTKCCENFIFIGAQGTQNGFNVFYE